MRTPFAGFLFVAFLATVAARAFPYGDYAPATPARRSRARVEYAESLAHGGSSSTSDGLDTAARGASARDASHASTLGNSDDAVEARMSSARVTARSVDLDDTWATVSRRDDDLRTTRATSDDGFESSSTLDDETHDPFPSAVEDPRDRNASHEDDVSDPFPSAVDGADDEDAPDPDAPYLSVDDIPDPDGALDDEESGGEDEEDGRGADEHAGGMDVEIDDEDRALDEEFHAEPEVEARRTKRDDRVEVEVEDDVKVEDARVDDEFDVSTSSLTSSSAGRQRRAGSNDYADAL